MMSLAPDGTDSAVGTSKHKGVVTGLAGHSAGSLDIFPLPRIRNNDSLLQAIASCFSCVGDLSPMFARDVGRTAKSLNLMASAVGLRSELAKASARQLDVVARIAQLVHERGDECALSDEQCLSKADLRVRGLR